MSYSRQGECHTRMAINAWSNESIQVRIHRGDSSFYQVVLERSSKRKIPYEVNMELQIHEIVDMDQVEK